MLKKTTTGASIRLTHHSDAEDLQDINIFLCYSYHANLAGQMTILNLLYVRHNYPWT